MFADISPLRRNREFRLLYVSQMVSHFGSMITYVAIPYQVQQLTGSPLMVGLLGGVQLVPMVLSSLVGGTYADRLDRRRLILTCEGLMLLGALGLAINAALPQPHVAVVFVLTAFLQTVNGFHRPSLEALTQKLVDRGDYQAVAALTSLRGTAGAILGPALGGALLAAGGAAVAYGVDALTFLWALALIARMRRGDFAPRSAHEASPLESFKEGFAFAMRSPALIGSYVVDIVAMTFAFPVALFPAMAQAWGGEKAVGLLYSAMSAGAMAVGLLSGWAKRVPWHGRMVILAAALWGLFIVGFGMADSFAVALGFLALAGAADMVSGIYRGTIWNTVIPNEMRGRLAGVEMISYMVGPLLGNLRVGAQASVMGNRVAIVSGGILCTLACVACRFVLPRFWAYGAGSAGDAKDTDVAGETSDTEAVAAREDRDDVAAE